MNKKQIVILSVILVVLALGLAFKSFIEKTDTRAATEVYSSRPFSFAPSKVEEIRIGRGPEAASVDLVKQNGQWIIRSLWDAKADEEKINEFLDAVSNAKGELRGTEKALLKDFGIDDADAFFLKLSGAAGIPMLDVRIGSETAGSGGFFVRKEGSPEVFLVETPFNELLGIFMPFEEAKPASNFWADLTLFNLNPEKVTKIEISHFENGNDTLTAGVERLSEGNASPEGWELIGSPEQGEVDPGKVTKYVVALNSVRAKAVMDPAGKEYGLEKPVWRLEVIEDENDQELILEAGPLEAGEDVYFLKFSGGSHIFSLATHYFEDLDAKNERFLKTDPGSSTESDQAS